MKKILFFILPLLLSNSVLGQIDSKGTSINQKQEKKMRIRIKNVEPKVYEIMNQLEKYLENSDLSTTHRELIKIRASQLNNCGYCLNLHSKAALKAGEDETRIFMLPLWKTVPVFYSEEEQVILQMTEEITFIQHGLSDETYNRAMDLFSENYVAQVIMAVTIINSWNRIGVSTHMEDECSI